MDMAPKTVDSIAASCPMAPSGVFGNPVGTCAGPAETAAGMSMLGPGVAAGVPCRPSSGATWSMGAAAMASRRASPWPGRGVSAGWFRAGAPVPEVERPAARYTAYPSPPSRTSPAAATPARTASRRRRCQPRTSTTAAVVTRHTPIR